jgi:hypothetical protein
MQTGNDYDNDNCIDNCNDNCNDNDTDIVNTISKSLDNDLETFVKCDIFTPDEISKIMASKLNSSGSLLEPSVGTGNLLENINLKNYNRIDVYELKSEYLIHITNKKINKKNEDFLKAEIAGLYDNIIMNPPYIRIQDLSIPYRKYLKDNFDELATGLVDIYYAFILKCIKLLSGNGKMVSITPNSYLYNKSSYKLRKHLFENKYIEEIIDFNDKKVFKEVSVYCCITIFTKTDKECLIYNNKKFSYTEINKNHSLFNNNTIDAENTLKNICKITNGIATLRDKIFIREKPLYDEACWVKITNGNTIKSIIYPYENGKIVEESKFKIENPLTYEYLVKNKEELAKRDKGHKKYPCWYAYGRSQSINPPQKKCIYIPCFINSNNIKESIFVNEPMLYQGCLCIEPLHDDATDKNNEATNIESIIKSIIEALIKNVDFISLNSSKRSGGWINISSRILYQVPI